MKKPTKKKPASIQEQLRNNEALDRVALIADLFEDKVSEHPACCWLSRPAIHKKCELVRIALAELSTEIARVALATK